MSAEPDSIAPAAAPEKKRQRGNRGGVRKRMAIAQSEEFRHPMPPFLSAANAAMPYPMRQGPFQPMGMRQPMMPTQKFGFFEARAGVRPGYPGLEKRGDVPPRPPGILGGPMNGRGPAPGPVPPPSFAGADVLNDPSMLIPPAMGGERNGVQNFPADRAEPAEKAAPVPTAGMNELFAKMVWKKLDMIQSPIRLSRLHTEIMNILQVAIAEESARP